MKDLLNKRVKKLSVPGIRHFSNLVSQFPDAINLTIGQPDFPTPEHIKQAGIQAVEENKTGYTHNAGLYELRKAVSEFVHEKYQLSYDPEKEIITTNGASEALDIAFRTILEEGCEVILPAPVYPGYAPLIELCGAVPVYVDTSITEFQVTADAIAEKITERTRCIVLPYPSNPLGSVTDSDNLLQLADLLKDKKIFVVSDEIYSELVYEGEHISIASLPGMREKTIVINGVSKSHSMTGWRIGFTCAPAYLSEEMLKVHLYSTIASCTISQYAALEALTHGLHDPAEMKKEYQKRRNYVYDRLIGMGLDAILPNGAFYLFASIKKLDMKSYDFAIGLLEEERVAVVPGSTFSEYGEGYIRISYASSLEVLQEGMNRMERYIQKIKES
ncbi:aminotransferase A [Ammoniphilus sp. CFH 90114]|uniref:aminotransferase A n=1 Tax=Ammoniphilus sp. CFH 90114 TaxID=2493665 RepID=UPI00100DF096|nr:aminotransferase A [Ammoniphilus sp. CFH 90114]RXT07088.1 aminotransferase A [Ammoniphilus sp. CFH 90114]